MMRPTLGSRMAENRTYIMQLQSGQMLGYLLMQLMAKFQKEYGDTVSVISTINMTDYALLNAEKILNDALVQYKKTKH